MNGRKGGEMRVNKFSAVYQFVVGMKKSGDYLENRRIDRARELITKKRARKMFTC